MSAGGGAAFWPLFLHSALIGAGLSQRKSLSTHSRVNAVRSLREGKLGSLISRTDGVP